MDVKRLFALAWPEDAQEQSCDGDLDAIMLPAACARPHIGEAEQRGAPNARRKARGGCAASLAAASTKGRCTRAPVRFLQLLLLVALLPTLAVGGPYVCGVRFSTARKRVLSGTRVTVGVCIKNPNRATMSFVPRDTWRLASWSVLPRCPGATDQLLPLVGDGDSSDYELSNTPCGSKKSPRACYKFKLDVADCAMGPLRLVVTRGGSGNAQVCSHSIALEVSRRLLALRRIKQQTDA